MHEDQYTSISIDSISRMKISDDNDTNTLDTSYLSNNSIINAESFQNEELSRYDSNKCDIYAMTRNTNITLTKSQYDVITTCSRLISDFKIIVIKGEALTGKHTAVLELFKMVNATVEHFNLCELAKTINRELSNQDVVQYLETLLDKLIMRMKNTDDMTRNKRRRLNNSSHINEQSTDYGIIYIRYYNQITDVLTDCYARSRFLLPLILKTFSDNLPNNIRLIITTHGCIIPDSIHWCVELTTSRNDMEHILSSYCENKIISADEMKYIMNISKIIPIGKLSHCINYAFSMTKHLLRTPSHNPSQNVFINEYIKCLTKFSGSLINTEKDIPKPIPDDDLIGVEHIIDQLNVSIINPMRFNIPGISLKKGMLLCGPPGTGKTSIGRWLAHEIKGKFYLIGGETTGRNLIDKLYENIRRARDNSPSVVFIDDGDILFDNDEIYRAFLTILDGIETYKRENICVIVTCMNMGKIPASLIRGGRLEMTLFTKLPNDHNINIILTKSLNKMMTSLCHHNPTLATTISPQLNATLLSNISSRMAGWNCADIHRCVNDVIRLLISNKGTILANLFNDCIREINRQYTLCGKCESTNIDYRPYDSYIS